MNQVYKVIWSKVRGCYVVVSEITKSNGKTRARHEKKSSHGGLIVAAALATSLYGAGGTAAASVDLGSGGTAAYDANGNLTIGDTNTKVENTDNNVTKNAIAIGPSATASAENAVAIGYKAKAEGKGAIVIGQYAKATGIGSTAFGGLQTTDRNGNLVTYTNTANGAASVAFGEGATANGAASLAFGMNTVAGGSDGSGQQSVAFGEDTQALGGRSVAFGEKTIAKYNDSVAFGNDTRASSTGATSFGNRTRALALYSTAWGNATVAADEESTAWGTDTIAGAKLDANGALTNDYTENGTQKSEKMDAHGNLAYVSNGTTYGIKQMAIDTGNEKHDYVVLSGQDGSKYVRDYQGSLWKVSVDETSGTVTVDKTVGTNGKVYNGQNKISLANTTINGSSVAITPDSVLNKAHEGTNGYNIEGYANATAFGYSTEASGDNATAWGNNTKATATGATAWGGGEPLKDSNGKVIKEAGTLASGNYATAFGERTTASGKNATAFGSDSVASGDNAVAWGGGSKVVTNSDGTISIVGTVASGNNATAFGERTTASGESATAFGSDSTASGSNSFAFGVSSVASGNNSLAGLGGTASNENSIALGKGTKANNTTENAVSVAIGQNAEASGAQSLAIGFGNITEQKADASTTTGNKNYPVNTTEATAKGAIAIGINTASKGEHSVAMGSYTDAAKDSSVAIGFDTHTLSDSTVAIGSGTQARGRYSVAMGLSSVAGKETNDANNPLDGGGSVAIGYAASAEASRSIAIGTGANAYENEFTTAIGDSATASQKGSVAVGAGSNATRAAGNMEGNTTYLAAYRSPANVTSETDATKKATWVATEGAVSVGGNTQYWDYDETGKKVKKTAYLTRQITNVAAGSADTDAVNVAQLKAAGVTVTSADNSVGITPSTDSTDYHTNYDLTVATATLNQEKTGSGDTAVPTGKITVTNPTVSKTENGTKTTVENKNAYVTGDSVANAINNSGFTLTTSKSAGTVTGTTAELINPGETVTLDAGKNIAITQDKTKITVATKDDLAVNSITYTTVDANDSTKSYTTKIDGKGVDVTPNETDSTKKITLTQDGLSNGGKKITNVGSGLGDTKDISTITNSATLQNAVNVGDLQKVAATHTAVTVNGSVEAPAAGVNGALGEYTKTTEGNLLLAQKKAENGKVTYDLKLNDTLNLGKADSKNGDQTVAGVDGSINVTGRTGASVNISGADGTIGLKGADGANALTVKSNNDTSKVGVDGDKGTTRLSYDTATTADGATTTTTHNLATMDDGLKFAGDDSTATVSKKLNETLQIRGDGTYDAMTKKSNGNIVTSVDGDGIKVALNDNINLHQSGSLSLGGDKSDTSTDGTDPITIRHFDANTLTVTGKDKDGNTVQSAAGDYITGLDNKTWSVENPTYVSGRAATEDQLKVVSDAAKNATTAAGKHTLLTVNDKDTAETKATAGQNNYGSYAGTTDNRNLLIAAKDVDGQTTYNIKLNDQLNIGKKGTDGADGKITVDTKGGTTVIIGHDGENGKDGLFISGNDGKDGKSGVSIIGPNGQTGDAGIDGKIGIAGKDGKDAVSISGKDGVGHIGLGIDGKDGAFTDISSLISTATLNDEKNIITKDGNGNVTKTEAPRIQYQYKDGNTTKTYEVATMDDGLKFIGDDDTAKPVVKKINETLQIHGDGTYDATTKKSDGNIVTSVDGDGIKVALNDNINLHQSGSLTLGGDTNGTEKDGTDPITIRHFDDKTLDVITGVDKEGKPITSKEGKAGDYITGLDNKTWNNESYVSGRAATEDQLHQVVSNLIGPSANGGFGLSANGSEVKKALGQTIAINGDGTYGTDGKETKAGNISTSVENGAVKVSLNKALNIDSTTMEKKDADGNIITNKTTAEGSTIEKKDASGKITASTTTNAGALTIKNGDVTTTINENGVSTNKVTVGDKTTIDNGSATIGGVTINGNGEKDGTDQHASTITGLSNKTFDTTNTDQYKDSGRAATEAQLKQVYDKASQHTTVTVNGRNEADSTDGNLVLKKDTKNQDGSTNYDLSLNDNLTIGKNGADGKAGTNGSFAINGSDGQSGIALNGNDGISVKGNDGKSGVSIIGGKDGQDGKVGIAGKDGMDAVSMSGKDGVGHIGLIGAVGKDGKNASADIKVVNGPVGVDGTDGNGGKDGMDRISYTDHNNKPHEVATTDDGVKFAGDSGDALKQKLNSTTNIKGGADAAKLSDGNIGIVSDGKDTLNVKLSKDIKGLDSIEAKTVNAETVNSSTFNAGNTTINNNGLTVKSDDGSRSLTVQDGNVSMGGNQIHNVAAGTADDDAVNVSQLKKMGGEISNVSRRVDRVGAGAAALAALHPQDFDPDDKWDFAVGYGNYRGANAAAVGAFYQPNEDTTLSIGGTVGGGENMVNAGISFKFGQGNHVTNSRVAMAKELLSLKDYVVKQDKMIQQQNEKIEKLEAMVGLSSGTPAEAKTQKRTLLFPDVPENHWAYDYVKKLADRGLLEGYPDGEFKGSRTLTRYEFAAIFERALENGAAADGDMERMAEEFDPEIRELSLSRFRVDRVSGDDNDHNKVERVRVNSRDEVVQQKNGEKSKIYRDVYGGQIDKAEAAAEK